MAARSLGCACAVCPMTPVLASHLDLRKKDVSACWLRISSDTCSPLAVLLRISSTVGWAAGLGLCAPGRILAGMFVVAGLKIARCTGVLAVSIALMVGWYAFFECSRKNLNRKTALILTVRTVRIKAVFRGLDHRLQP
jgi:hypothetical protein